MELQSFGKAYRIPIFLNKYGSFHFSANGTDDRYASCCHRLSREFVKYNVVVVLVLICMAWPSCSVRTTIKLRTSSTTAKRRTEMERGTDEQAAWEDFASMNKQINLFHYSILLF